MSNDFSTWYNSVPQFTRYWLSATVGLSLLGKSGIISPMLLFLDTSLVFSKFQIWRPVTALFFYPPSFHWLVNCFFLYNYSSRLEKDHYLGSPGDYLFLLIFNWAAIVIASIFFNLMLLMDPMVLSVLYIWCQLNKDVIVSFWFGTRFKAMYLPWVLLMFNMILNNSFMPSLVGILVGHLYYFLKFTYPQELGGNNWIETPSIIKRYYPDTRPSGVFGFSASGTRADPPPQQRTGLFGGAGRRLAD